MVLEFAHLMQAPCAPCRTVPSLLAVPHGGGRRAALCPSPMQRMGGTRRWRALGSTAWLHSHKALEDRSTAPSTQVMANPDFLKRWRKQSADGNA